MEEPREEIMEETMEEPTKKTRKQRMKEIMKDILSWCYTPFFCLGLFLFTVLNVLVVWFAPLVTCGRWRPTYWWRLAAAPI